MDKGKINIGLCLFRIIMCFEVVLCHFWGDTSYSKIFIPFKRLQNYAVCFFMFMSFYLVQKSFLKKDTSYVKRRLCRLVLPHVVWAIVYWVVYKVAEVILNQNLVGGLSDLIWQIFTGSSPNINPAMWFQMVLLVLTLVFVLLFSLFSIKTGLIAINVMMIVALILQYTGINYAFFSQSRYELMYSVGRICEMLPYATLGFMFSYCGIYDKMRKHRVLVAIVSIIICVLMIHTSIIPSALGYGYSGLEGVCVSILLMNAAILIPFDKAPLIIQRIIIMVSKYTMGIYCMHNLVGNFVSLVFVIVGLEIGTFTICCLIYLACFVCALIISKMPLRICRQLVE